jgi:hypothetical protein
MQVAAQAGPVDLDDVVVVCLEVHDVLAFGV